MKRLFVLMISLLLCFNAGLVFAEEDSVTDETAATGTVAVEENTAVSDVDVLGVWTYDVDLAVWFEYKGTDVDGKVAYIWEFKTDGTFVQKYADPTSVSNVVKALMTKILTAEIAAEGTTISTVATAEGYSSVDAFVEAIIKTEKLDALGTEEIAGVYTVKGDILTMSFTDTDGKVVEAVDTVTIVDGVMTLVGAENETISMTFVPAETPAE